MINSEAPPTPKKQKLLLEQSLMKDEILQLTKDLEKADAEEKKSFQKTIAMKRNRVASISKEIEKLQKDAARAARYRMRKYVAWVWVWCWVGSVDLI